MEYGLLYNCPFDSDNGHKFIIRIYKKNYEGAVIKRSLGGAPVLRQDKDGAICGSSLEFKLEAIQNDEFVSLYTSDAFQYKVELICFGSVRWSGFITPEIYSEPDIAPPYDVNILATDGLGELKNTDIDITKASTSLKNHIKNALDLTGLENMQIAVISSLLDNSEDLTVKEFFDQQIDLTFLEGKTYYDLLKKILDSINATIRLYDGYLWLIMRETDITVNNDGSISPMAVHIDDKVSGEFQLMSGTIGNLGEQDLFPVGNLTKSIQPAYKRFIVVSDNHYKSILNNSEMTVDRAWIKNAGASYDTDHYLLPRNSYIEQTITLNGGYPKRLLFSFDVRCQGSQTYDEEQTVSIGIKLKTTSGVIYYYKPYTWKATLKDKKNTPTTVLVGGSWTSSITWYDITIPPASSNSIDDLVSVQLPLDFADALINAGEMNTAEVTFYIKNTGAYYNEMIHRAELVIYDQTEGTKTTVNINNNARETAGDIEILIPVNNSSSSNIPKLLKGVLQSSYGVITRWETSKHTNKEYNELIALDYAQSYALPRWKKTGKLYVSDTVIGVDPVMCQDSVFMGRTHYIMNTWSWDLFNDELQIEMISLPTGSLSGNITQKTSTANGERNTYLDSSSFESVDSTEQDIDDGTRLN